MKNPVAPTEIVPLLFLTLCGLLHVAMNQVITIMHASDVSPLTTST